MSIRDNLTTNLFPLLNRWGNSTIWKEEHDALE